MNVLGPIAEYVGLRPKLYSILRSDEQPIKKAKGVKKYVLQKQINYKDTLFNKTKSEHSMNMLRSVKHNIYGLTVKKATLSPLDTKRLILMVLQRMPLGMIHLQCHRWRSICNVGVILTLRF